MDTPPVPTPRNAFLPQNDTLKRPVPLPRTKPQGNHDRVSATNFIRSIGSVSKQLSEDVAQKVSNSAKSANEKIEKSIIDGSKFARGTLEKTINTSKAVRDSVTKSVLEGTAGIKFRVSKKSEHTMEEQQKSMSMPGVDVSFFDNIQFHSPLLEQKRSKNYEEQLDIMPALQLNASQLDNLSLFSNHSDQNLDTVSLFSRDSRDNQCVNDKNVNSECEITYDTPRQSRANSMISIRSAPEIPDRRNKRESLTEVIRQNSLYENWTLPNSSTNPSVPKVVVAPRPSKSTIYEFDPLNNNVSGQKYEGVSNELLLLESFLIGDTYGTIVSSDNGNDENLYDFSETDYFNPPTPPERFDSLFPMENSPNTSQTEYKKENTSSWYVGNNDTQVSGSGEENKTTNSMIQRFSNMLKFENVLHKSNKQNVQKKAEIIQRPSINNLPVAYYCGTLNKIVSGVVEDLFKNSQSRYCTLSDQKLMCYSDPTNSILKEAYSLENILSIQVVLPLSSSTTSNSYCFELIVATGMRSSPRKVLFSCASASERRNWVQHIAENLTNVFPTKYTAEYTRCGWCYLKEGVSGEWLGAWVMLVRRVLLYHSDSEMKIVDLRKTRCVVTKEAEEETKSICPSDVSEYLLLDCSQATLYLRFPNERELNGWKYMIKLAAHNNGARIHHQQLTKEDVPVVVDKCISFIYAHGSLSVGIYRRAGSSVVLGELLSRFRRDAWSVQLTPGQHSEHDVAGVLKRFFRDLPEALIPQNEHTRLTSALDMKEPSSRFAEYKSVMTSLSLVAYNSARKLFAHLYFLHTMSHANKMSAENLASVWAPTIMPTALTSQTLQTAWSAKEQLVVRDLIANYEAIWEPTDVEIRREAAIRRVLVRVLSNNAMPSSPKAAGDLRAWIYVMDRQTCHQVSLTPNKTSADVCIELCEKANTDPHLLMMEEVICNESMSRIVHIDEIVLDVVLRWGYWDEEDRKDNYLLIKHNKTIQEMDTLRHTTSLVCGELRFANESTKTFKSHMFEFNNSKLGYFKDRQGSHKIEEWHVKDILWYVGHEPKRNPQSRWSITFIPRNKQKRSKDRPWFGCTLAGAVTEDHLKWMTAMTFAEHNNILPTPRLIIT